MALPICRFCQQPLVDVFCDLGLSPPSNAYLYPHQLAKGEFFFPLIAYVCSRCLLVQLQQFQTPQEIFSEYAYFSSYSETWLAHAKAYSDYVIERFGYAPGDFVVEIASNDGYLLRNFKDLQIRVLGIEPAENVARVAEAAGIPTSVCFFGTQTAERLVQEGSRPNLLIANNVLAHVPELNDFVAGMKILLHPSGVFTVEVPHLLRLIEESQFDTIYHEHFSYFSFTTLEKIFARHGLSLFDVQELKTHGGSLRIFGQHEGAPHAVASSVARLKDMEENAGLQRLTTYSAFRERPRAIKRSLLSFLISAKAAGKTIVGYGAPAKGNTLLNYCGIGTDFLDYTVDRSPHKQGTYLPGTRIPVLSPEAIRSSQPDYVLVLPWNLRDEIVGQLAYVRSWGGTLVVAIPSLEILT